MKKPLLILLVLALIGAGIFFYLREQSLRALPRVKILQDESGGYSLLVDGRPYVVKGASYHPIPIGKDYLYNFWSDPHETWKKDGRLMKAMGANTIRFYRLGKDPAEVKKIIRGLHRGYGIRALVGHYLGFMEWPPANYAQEGFRERVAQDVLEMVRLYKDEPGILAWVLGNENNYSFDLNVRSWSSDELDRIEDMQERNKAKARIYYSFVNDLAKKIKAVDPVRPVVMGVGEVKSLDIASEVARDIDIIGIIAFRGPTFGNLFRQVKQKFDRPVIMIEWGADRYNAFTDEEDEVTQAEFVKLQWKDIERNGAGGGGAGNALGGMVFEWNDEWWKANENLPHTWVMHDKAGQWSNSSYYYDYEVPGRQNMNEEWWGMVGLKPRRTEGGGDLREPKKAYHVLKELWS